MLVTSFPKCIPHTLRNRKDENNTSWSSYSGIKWTDCTNERVTTLNFPDYVTILKSVGNDIQFGVSTTKIRNNEPVSIHVRMTGEGSLQVSCMSTSIDLE